MGDKVIVVNGVEHHYDIVGFLPLNGGYWKTTKSNDWTPLTYLETVLDFSILPDRCYGKLYAELCNDTPNNPVEREIEVRFAYQQRVKEWIPVNGSNIKINATTQWRLEESDWFQMPTEGKVSCLWIEGRTNGGLCSCALANIAIVRLID